MQAPVIMNLSNVLETLIGNVSCLQVATELLYVTKMQIKRLIFGFFLNNLSQKPNDGTGVLVSLALLQNKIKHLTAANAQAAAEDLY